MISDHGAAGPGQLTSGSTFHWGQQRRNSGYQMSPGYAYVTPTSTADPTITTIMITKQSVLMSLNVCLSCKFPLAPSLISITACTGDDSTGCTVHSTHIEAGCEWVKIVSVASSPSHSFHSQLRSLLLPQLYDLVMWHEHKIYQLQSVL